MKATLSKTTIGTFEIVDRKPDQRNKNIHYPILDSRNMVSGAANKISEALDRMDRVVVHYFDNGCLTVGIDVTNIKQEQLHGHLSHAGEDVLGAIETTAKSIDLVPQFSTPDTARSTNHRPGYVNQPPKPLRFSHRH